MGWFGQGEERTTVRINTLCPIIITTIVVAGGEFLRDRDALALNHCPETDRATLESRKRRRGVNILMDVSRFGVRLVSVMEGELKIGRSQEVGDAPGSSRWST